ncbi:hypothetical protein GCM10022420_029020 [Streptomyces iranensis]|uniref:Molybdopterin dehydrogenase FAD-binding protein n=1 Tax=Streptomyces iranensis TaxID=576784 RepID=A0ABS4N9M6_9ACTN|nr:hypothetical protein [Streptomyces iranensis]
MRSFTYTRAADTSGVLAAARRGGRYIAGGTTLVDLMREGVEQPGTLGPMPLHYGPVGWGLVMRMACVPVWVGCGQRWCSARLSW